MSRVTPMVTANTSDKLACALHGWRPCRPFPSCPAGGARHPAAARGTLCRKQQGIAYGIIEQYSFVHETWASYTKLKFCISRKSIIYCYTPCIYMIWYFLWQIFGGSRQEELCLNFCVCFYFCPCLSSIVYGIVSLQIYGKTAPGGGGGCARRGVGDPPQYSYHPMKNHCKNKTRGGGSESLMRPGVGSPPGKGYPYEIF